ncbi:MAG: nucleoside triphosphate pyrophosphohydrolase [Bacteroidota bacterium]
MSTTTPTNPATAYFNRLLLIMDELREKCPWDKKQTIESLRSLTLEETYELADAILSGNWSDIREELGDLILHIVFYSRIASEQGAFTIADVLDGICEKLIKRHPHIYGEVQVTGEEDVKRNWEQIKLSEGKKSVLSGVPVSMPALVKAIRLQEKARQVGFDWDNARQVLDKVREEEGELNQAIAEGNQAAIEAEFGDLLFAWINYARFIGVDPESALSRTNQKFIRRFQGVEQLAKDRGLDLHSLDLTALDALWNEIKRAE